MKDLSSRASKKWLQRILVATITVYLFAIGLPHLNVFNEVKKVGQSSAATGILGVAYAEEVAHAVKNFSEGDSRGLRYKTPDGAGFRYSMIKSSDNVVAAAAKPCLCSMCFPPGKAKGLEKKRDEMVCSCFEPGECVDMDFM